MSERLDTVLRWVILIYGAICIYGFLYLTLPFNLPYSQLLLELALIESEPYAGYVSRGYQWILLSMMIVTRFILFGKTYQK